MSIGTTSWTSRYLTLTAESKVARAKAVITPSSRNAGTRYAVEAIATPYSSVTTTTTTSAMARSISRLIALDMGSARRGKYTLAIRFASWTRLLAPFWIACETNSQGRSDHGEDRIRQIPGWLYVQHHTEEEGEDEGEDERLKHRPLMPKKLCL